MVTDLGLTFLISLFIRYSTYNTQNGKRKELEKHHLINQTFKGFYILGFIIIILLFSIILSAWFLPEHIFNLISSNGPNLRNATQSINIENPTKVIELSLILQLVGIFITVLLGSKILDFMAMKELDERFKKLEEKNEEKLKEIDKKFGKLEKENEEKLKEIDKESDKMRRLINIKTIKMKRELEKKLDEIEKDLKEKLEQMEKRMSETVARRIDAYMKEILILLQKEREKGEGKGEDK